jgi:hypothetical protein
MPATQSSRLLMTLSAAALAALGLSTSFLPQEILSRAAMPADRFPVALIQIAGALYVGFAMLNWSAKGALLGGIYGRPIVLANFAHFAIGAIVLVKILAVGQVQAEAAILTAVYVVFAAWFGFVLFGGGPKQA